VNRTINLYRDGPRGLSFWPASSGAEPIFRALVAGELVRYDDQSGRILVRSRRRGVVAPGPLALVRCVRAGLPGFRPWEDGLPADLAAFEPPARRRPRPRGPWAIYLVPTTPGRPMRCLSVRKAGRGRTTFGARYAKRFPRRAEALARLDELRAWGLERRGFRYLVDRL
jgi:hypothetical protein